MTDELTLSHAAIDNDQLQTSNIPIRRSHTLAILRRSARRITWAWRRRRCHNGTPSAATDVPWLWQSHLCRMTGMSNPGTHLWNTSTTTHLCHQLRQTDRHAHKHNIISRVARLMIIHALRQTFDAEMKTFVNTVSYMLHDPSDYI